MLASLTITAVSRGWPPPVYQRLVSQLENLTDLGENHSILKLFERLISENPSNPLLFEYICALSNDPHSRIYIPVLLEWLSENGEVRSQPTKDLMCYLARYAAREWKLPQDFVDQKKVATACESLIEQAKSGQEESRLLLVGLSRGVLPKLYIDLPEWREKVETSLNRLGACVKGESLHGAPSRKGSLLPDNSNNNAAEDTDKGDVDMMAESNSKSAPGHSSRTLRLLWLDWMLRTAENFEFNNLHRQLDLLWPGDRESVISYEICVTAFDVLACPGPNAPPQLAEFFIKRSLPLLLQKLNASKSIDSVISRVFTTLDKEIVENVEQRSPGIRAEFGAACVDIGICDPTVMHAVHRSHTAKLPLPSANLPPISELLKSPSVFLDMNPVNQADLAGQILDAARGVQNALGRHDLANLCAQLVRYPQFCDNLFVHVPVRDFLEAVFTYADAAGTVPDEDGGAGHVYSDLGYLIVFASWICDRYQNIRPPSNWTASFIGKKNFTNASRLPPKEATLMSQWIVGLFSGSGSGIADELLRPFNELGETLPALLQQAVRAYRSAVIDRETLKGGLDYLVHPSSVTLFAPLVVRVLKADLFEGTHQASTIECLIFFLEMLLKKKSAEYDIAKMSVLTTAREIVTELTACVSCNEGTTPLGPNTKELFKALSALVDDLSKQVGSIFEIAETRSFRLGEASSLAETLKQNTTALMDWQLKLHGAPTLPSFFEQAKAALGPAAVKRIIEEVTCNQSTETMIALLVFDGLWAKKGRLVSLDDDSQVVSIAKDILKEFDAIRADHPRRPEVVVAGDTRAEDNKDAASKNAESNMSVEDGFFNTEMAGSQKTELQGGTTNSGSNNGNARNAPGAGHLGSFDGFDSNAESIAHLVSSAPNDFDNDFVSQPMMNLADLDSAMDFAWE